MFVVELIENYPAGGFDLLSRPYDTIKRVPVYTKPDYNEEP